MSEMPPIVFACRPLRRLDGGMKTPAIMMIGLWAAAGCGATPLTDEPVAELKLGSGKTLKTALARSYSSSAVLVKHADGAMAVPYEDFPQEMRAALIALRPAVGEPAAASKTASLERVSYDFPAPPTVDDVAGEEQVLSGQVFVAAPQGGNVKLGGVKVSVYAKADFRRQADWYFAHPWEASKTHSRNAETLAKAGDAAGAMKQFEAATETAALGWMLVAQAQFSTTTDADGRFTLKHRVPAPYFVVAQASRVVEGETENYRWVVPSTLIDEPANLLLFNENME